MRTFTLRTSTFMVGCVLVASMCACSGNLSRPEAKRQLEASYKEKVMYEHLDTGFKTWGGTRMHPCAVPPGQWRTTLPDVATLEQAGLLSVKVNATSVKENYMDMTGDHIVDLIAITPTEKGKPFYVGTSDGRVVMVSAKPMIEILGVTEPADAFGRKMCSVSFQVSWKNNQIGEVLKRSYKEEKKEAPFVKYDNGWRLEK